MKERINFWIDLELRDGLNTIKKQDGVSEAEQIRRGIRLWLATKGIRVKPKTQRTRKGGK